MKLEADSWRDKSLSHITTKEPVRQLVWQEMTYTDWTVVCVTASLTGAITVMPAFQSCQLLRQACTLSGGRIPDSSHSEKEVPKSNTTDNIHGVHITHNPLPLTQPGKVSYGQDNSRGAVRGMFFQVPAWAIEWKGGEKKKRYIIIVMFLNVICKPCIIMQMCT
jgi:hypothetical protein